MVEQSLLSQLRSDQLRFERFSACERMYISREIKSAGEESPGSIFRSSRDARCSEGDGKAD
jgi:hypothetical protein